MVCAPGSETTLAGPFLLFSAASCEFSWNRRMEVCVLPVNPSFGLIRMRGLDATFCRLPPHPSCVAGPAADMP